MRSIQMALCVLIGVFCYGGYAQPVLQQLLKALLGTGENDGHRLSAPGREGQLYGRACRGLTVKPTAYRTKIDNTCAGKYPSQKRCARICRLEMLKVITKGKVNPRSWRSYVEYSYPTVLSPELVPKMRDCGGLYAASSSMGNDCEENEAFLSCLSRATDEVCKEDKIVAIEDD